MTKKNWSSLHYFKFFNWKYRNLKEKLSKDHFLFMTVFYFLFVRNAGSRDMIHFHQSISRIVVGSFYFYYNDRQWAKKFWACLKLIEFVGFEIIVLASHRENRSILLVWVGRLRWVANTRSVGARYDATVVNVWHLWTSSIFPGATVLTIPFLYLFILIVIFIISFAATTLYSLIVSFNNFDGIVWGFMLLPITIINWR